jgi:hypothetical protein
MRVKMKKFIFLALVVIGFSACNNEAEIKVKVDSLGDKLDTLGKKVETKTREFLDSTKSKGGRIVDGVKERLDRKDSAKAAKDSVRH